MPGHELHFDDDAFVGDGEHAGGAGNEWIYEERQQSLQRNVDYPMQPCFIDCGLDSVRKSINRLRVN